MFGLGDHRLVGGSSPRSTTAWNSRGRHAHPNNDAARFQQPGKQAEPIRPAA
jgi:hypothetical protein